MIVPYNKNVKKITIKSVVYCFVLGMFFEEIFTFKQQYLFMVLNTCSTYKFNSFKKYRFFEAFFVYY